MAMGLRKVLSLEEKAWNSPTVLKIRNERLQEEKTNFVFNSLLKSRKASAAARKARRVTRANRK